MSSEDIISPCNQDCEIDYKTGYCIGCFRTTDEILEWTFLSHEERQHFMDVILPNRKKETQQ